MKYLKLFENFDWKDLKLDGLKVNDRRVFDSIIFYFKSGGRGRLIDYNVETRDLSKCNLDEEACLVLMELLEKYQKEISEAYGKEVYSGLEEAIGYYYVGLKNKKEKKSSGIKRMNLPIFISDYEGSQISLFVKKMSKDDKTLTFWVSRWEDIDSKKIIVSDGIFKWGDDDLHFWSHYTKSLSKFQDNVRKSKEFYELIKSNVPNPPPFITPKTFKDLGWKDESEAWFKFPRNVMINLYDNNEMLFTKDGKILIFNFNFYKLTIFNEDFDKLQEESIKNISDLSFLK